MKSEEKKEYNNFSIASVISVCNLASLIKTIDPCEKIVNEIAKAYL